MWFEGQATYVTFFTAMLSELQHSFRANVDTQCAKHTAVFNNDIKLLTAIIEMVHTVVQIKLSAANPEDFLLVRI